MDPTALSSGISSGGGIISSIVNAFTGAKQMREAQQFDFEKNLELAKYNNTYNYNLWKEQMQYNSPVEQRKRLEAAGLNPNYNSVDSGNISLASPSQIPSNLSNSMSVADKKAQLRLASLNQITEMVSSFVRNLSNLSGIPQSVTNTRAVLRDLLDTDVIFRRSKAFKAFLDSYKTAIDDFGVDLQNGFVTSITPDGGDVLLRRSPGLGEDYSLLRNESMKLQNDVRSIEAELKRYDLDNLKPAELVRLKTQLRKIGLDADLTQKQLDWFVANSLTKIGASSIGALLGVARFFK